LEPTNMKKSSATTTKKQAKKSTSGAELRSFRHNVSVLKRKGLVSPKVDARSVTPTKTLRAAIKKFSDVLSGNARVFTVPKGKTVGQYAEDYSIRGAHGHIVLPKSERLNRKGQIVTAKMGPIASMTRQALPTGADYESKLRAQLAALGPLKDGELYGVRRKDGGYALKFYTNPEDLLNLLRGSSGQQGTDEGMSELYIVKMNRKDTLNMPNKGERLHPYRQWIAKSPDPAGAKARKSRKQNEKRNAMTQEQHDAYNIKEAARRKASRAKKSLA
jgi:hypothetical protein